MRDNQYFFFGPIFEKVQGLIGSCHKVIKIFTVFYSHVRYK